MEKKGSDQDINTYRPIALTVLFRKILEKILKPRIENSMLPLDIAQGGFRQGRSSLDLVFTLDSIVKEQIRKKQPCFQVFLDIKGAYDSVDREILWRKCEQKNIVGPRLKLLKFMFNHTEVAIRINGKESRYVKMGRGLLQGSLISPLLFNVFIDDLPRILRSKNKGVNIGENKINSLIYADDIVVISKSSQILQRCLRTCERHSRRNGYAFAPEKCEVILPLRQNDTEDTPKITLDGKDLKYSNIFNYLGVPISAKGVDFKVMCHERVEAAIRMSEYFRIVGCNGGGYPPTIVRRILHSFVRPLMEYGLGLQYLRKSEKNRLDKAWFSIWKRNQTLPKSTSSLAILKTYRSPAMSYRNDKLNSAYLARLKTMENDSLAKKIFDQASTPRRRCSKLNVVKKSKDNRLWSRVQEWLVNKHSYKKLKRSRFWKDMDLEHLQLISEVKSSMPRQIMRKTAQAIRVPSMRMEYFLTQRVNSISSRRTRRKLLLWRLGTIPGKVIKCMACQKDEVASRHHVACCSMSVVESTEAHSTYSTNPLDELLNEEGMIKEGSRISTAENLIEFITQRCLGRSSGYKPGAAVEK